MLYRDDIQQHAHPALPLMMDKARDKSGKRYILVIDDDLTSRRFMNRLLARNGYHVHDVADGVAGLQVARVFMPDLILLDIDMPKMNGFEVCECLKADPRTQDIPVVFVSGRGSMEDKARGFAAGGIDFLCKPFRIVEMLDSIEAQFDD